MSFRTYMSEVRASGSPLGFFARALDTSGLPEPRSWEELLSYLIGRKADPVVIVSASVYWRDYRASQGLVAGPQWVEADANSRTTPITRRMS